jgi:hypothetical protein
LAAGVGKAQADAAADETPRCHAERLGVEIAQIDDVDGHGRNLARNAAALRPTSCVIIRESR